MGLKKKLLIGALALTTLGTVGGSEGYPPFHTKKVGTSVGVNLPMPRAWGIYDANKSRTA